MKLVPKSISLCWHGQERDTLLWLADKVNWLTAHAFRIPVPIEKSADLEMAKAGKIRWIFPARGRRNGRKRSCEKAVGHTAF